MQLVTSGPGNGTHVETDILQECIQARPDYRTGLCFGTISGCVHGSLGRPFGPDGSSIADGRRAALFAGSTCG